MSGPRQFPNDIENCFCPRVARSREHLSVSACRAGAGAGVWAAVYASVCEAVGEVIEVSAASVGGGTRLRHEPARGGARGAQRLRLYAARDQLRVAVGHAARDAAAGAEDQ